MTRSAKVIAFGSCNRQKLPQSFWTEIGSIHPDHFLWTGDAVYTKGYSFPALPTAFEQLLSNHNYSYFAAHTYVDGVWDDHDYGVNDAGTNVVDKAQRAIEYLTFLEQSNPNFHEDHGELDRSGQHGLYHASTVQMGPATVKFLFLDTRSFRDNHFIPSLGQVKFPLSAIIASAFRGLYSVLGFGREYAGDVLGEEQWQWLSNELASSPADVHFLISSIQVLTSNPVVESWGHFPLAKKRLMNLLAQHDPKQLHFLSGDVHLAEISVAKAHRADGSVQEWKEITSSGLTHTCQDNLINKLLCPAMLHLFAQHRESRYAFYAQRNFGTITLQGSELQVDIHSLEPKEMLQVPPLTSVKIPLQEPSVTSKSKIMSVDFADFYVIPWYLQLLIISSAFLLVRYLVVVRRRVKKVKIANIDDKKQY